MSERPRQDWFGVWLGVLVFLTGIGILVFTFVQAADLFSRPPSDMVRRENVDVGQIGKSFADLVLQLGLLLIMSIVGSLVASKGIRLYIGARSVAETRDKSEN